MAGPLLCPCFSLSRLRYAECCAPLHEGEREAADAETLMRSRYSAFATRSVEYLWSTLHPDHDDRTRSRGQVVAELAAVCAAHKYAGLRILDRRAPDEGGIAKVLFFAKVFRKGRDLSFVELSLFARAEGGWRYLAGEGVARPVGGVGGLTIAAVEGSRARA